MLNLDWGVQGEILPSTLHKLTAPGWQVHRIALANDDPASPRHAGSVAHVPFGKDNFPKTPFKPSQNKLSICDEMAMKFSEKQPHKTPKNSLGHLPEIFKLWNIIFWHQNEILLRAGL